MDIIRGEIVDNQGTLSYIARNIREDHNESNVNVGNTVFTAQKVDNGLEVIEWISVKPLLETSNTIPKDEYGS